MRECLPRNGTLPRELKGDPAMLTTVRNPQVPRISSGATIRIALPQQGASCAEARLFNHAFTLCLPIVPERPRHRVPRDGESGLSKDQGLSGLLMPAGGRSKDDQAHRRVHEKLDETPRNSAAAVSDVSLQRQPDEWPT
jgi:hypothetical protein